MITFFYLFCCVFGLMLSAGLVIVGFGLVSSSDTYLGRRTNAQEQLTFIVVGMLLVALGATSFIAITSSRYLLSPFTQAEKP